MTTPRLTIATIAAATALVVGCSSHHTSREADRHTSAGPAVGTRTSASAAPVIPSESPRPSSVASSLAVQPDPAITTPAIPDPSAATATAVGVARAWAIAAHSSSYLDPRPGSWTARTTPFVTGPEAAAERRQRIGGGGSIWAEIQSGKCVTSLRDLAAGIPSDAPTGPERHIVYLTAITALTCTTGQVQLSHFAAQLTVTRVHGRWLVADVRH